MGNNAHTYVMTIPGSSFADMSLVISDFLGDGESVQLPLKPYGLAISNTINSDYVRSHCRSQLREKKAKVAV